MGEEAENLGSEEKSGERDGAEQRDVDIERHPDRTPGSRDVTGAQVLSHQGRGGSGYGEGEHRPDHREAESDGVRRLGRLAKPAHHADEESRHREPAHHLKGRGPREAHDALQHRQVRAQVSSADLDAALAAK